MENRVPHTAPHTTEWTASELVITCHTFPLEGGRTATNAHPSKVLACTRVCRAASCTSAGSGCLSDSWATDGQEGLWGLKALAGKQNETESARNGEERASKKRPQEKTFLPVQENCPRSPICRNFSSDAPGSRPGRRHRAWPGSCATLRGRHFGLGGRCHPSPDG